MKYCAASFLSFLKTTCALFVLVVLNVGCFESESPQPKIVNPNRDLEVASQTDLETDTLDNKTPQRAAPRIGKDSDIQNKGTQAQAHRELLAYQDAKIMVCDANNCRCRNGKGKDLSLEQARYICRDAPEVPSKEDDGDDDARTKEEAPNKARKSEKEKDTQRESFQTTKEVLRKRRRPQRAVSACWSACGGSHLECLSRCGVGPGCWASCPEDHESCAERCGPGTECWSKCKEPRETCSLRCGGSSAGAPNGGLTQVSPNSPHPALRVETVR